MKKEEMKKRKIRGRETEKMNQLLNARKELILPQKKSKRSRAS